MRPASIITTLGLLLVGASALGAHDHTLAKRDLVNHKGKYFNEPGGSAARGHYDARFFTEELSYNAHRVVLRNLIKSYLTTCKENNVETWLAHGTLLGWWWNGKIMPWDYDLDVQMSTSTLTWVGHNLNRTEHEYKWTDASGAEQTSKYILDINPHHIEKGRGDGLNIIDARWIDLANGAYVDITGLAERELPKKPGIWSCRNYHRYHTTDLFPMRQSEFEGTPAMLPYNFERILTEEYGAKSLVAMTWQGHHWDIKKKEWLKD